MWERADAVVWLDLPRSTVMRQVTLRTLRRTIRREELWNGNHEPLVNLCFWRDESILHWAWTQHAKYERRYVEAMALPHARSPRVRPTAEPRRSRGLGVEPSRRPPLTPTCSAPRWVRSEPACTTRLLEGSTRVRTAEQWWVVAAGSVGLVCFVAGALFTRAPAVDQPIERAMADLRDRRAAVLTGSVLSITGAALLLWPLAFVAAEPGVDRWPSLAIASMAAWVFGFGFLALASLLLVAIVWRTDGPPDVEVARTFLDLGHLRRGRCRLPSVRSPSSPPPCSASRSTGSDRGSWPAPRSRWRRWWWRLPARAASAAGTQAGRPGARAAAQRSSGSPSSSSPSPPEPHRRTGLRSRRTARRGAQAQPSSPGATAERRGKLRWRSLP